MERTSYIEFLFNNPPGPESDFVECENDQGHSIKAGEWYQRGDGFWVLRVKPEVFGNV